MADVFSDSFGRGLLCTFTCNFAVLHHVFYKFLELLGRQSTDPFVLIHCVSALLIVNQRWGSHCYAHHSYFFFVLFSMV